MIRNYDILWVIIFGTITFSTIIFFLISFVLYFQRRQLQNLQEKIQIHSKYAQELLQTQLEVQNATLQQTGQELHDNIGQLLSVAKINLNILEDSPHSSDDTEYIKQTNEIIGQAISDLRILTKTFDGDFVKDFGLEESLSNELLRIRKTKKFQTELIVDGERYGLGYEKEIVLFRISQEILNNSIKHANAKNIRVNIFYHPELFTLAVQDDGSGFNYDSLITKDLKNSGSGLRNMRRRSELIGAFFNLDSKIGYGTSIKISLSPTTS